MIRNSACVDVFAIDQPFFTTGTQRRKVMKERIKYFLCVTVSLVSW